MMAEVRKMLSKRVSSLLLFGGDPVRSLGRSECNGGNVFL